MNLSSVDLNLLVVFEALYQTRNVTAAGRRLNRAQPSVSNALARLRILLNDPLFVRSGGAMAPTPRAHQLMPQIQQVLEQIHLALAPPARFDPATAGQRRFTLAAGDYADILLLPVIISRLRQTAPGIDIRVSRLDRHNIYRQLDRGEVDIALGGHLSGAESHYVRTLFEEHLVCIASRSHPQLADGRWDLARYLSLPHGLYAPADDGSARGLVDRRLAEIGGQRRVAVTFSHIAALPAVVADSDLIATLAASAARHFSDPQRVRILPLPDELAIAPFPIELIAGRQAQRDPALIWLCELIGQLSFASSPR
ncbi:LysR family transcriptional regulator [Serratia marcescens]|uniref:LysR family transcriptional regulator n=1 Tax=Serratia marcescens TaxID=615 RepID=UPI000B5F9EE1|nr:LysR family transcriptional regulator [Serratia marcescens]ASM17317.1 LysR family transcriptional regulator [Serratia marcescens]MBY4848816.1 LysR family transcriptional regulator [Serratia marcescens]MCH9866663.1 LysR family transcriptional regulator [Serratia marcescens]UOO26894.1 LysR family transcriptional regulator [Serratia marcescens]CAI0776344.1 Nodulation protein D 2 [Serratia marcescens]